MQKLKIYQVDNFTGSLFSGNSAAVCWLDYWLPDAIMQSIAEENNLSETAFVLEENNKFTIRWFTPTIEIDLCGHATLATAHILFGEMGYSEDYVEFHTKTGDRLKVFRDKDILKMNFPSHKPVATNQDLGEIESAFNLRPSSFLLGKYGVAVFNEETEIKNIKVNFSALEYLPYDGIMVTAPGEKVDFVSRFFAPKLGILEDPVTGSAHCELIPYWSDRLAKKKMLARQLSHRGGELICEDLDDRVLIGGRAVTYLRGEINF